MYAFFCNPLHCFFALIVIAYLLLFFKLVQYESLEHFNEWKNPHPFTPDPDMPSYCRICDSVQESKLHQEVKP